MKALLTNVWGNSKWDQLPDPDRFFAGSEVADV